MDENSEKLKQQDGQAISNQEEMAANRRNKKKIKATIYLTEEAEQAFTELYIHRLRKDRKTDRSLIACDAIQALYEKECVKQ
ncbi:hypothetical protein BN1013_02451 [Candidatus Rubidus massiliensis]|nr:hypothetical protein BN1013_02451 [Candidatus Rubidus massiliensis]